jgi:hypothetical protein
MMGETQTMQAKASTEKEKVALDIQMEVFSALRHHLK